MNQMDTRDIIGFSFIWIGIFLAFAIPEHSIYWVILVTGTITILICGVVMIGNK